MSLGNESPSRKPRVQRFYYPVHHHSYYLICLLLSLSTFMATFMFGIHELRHGFVPLTMAGIFLLISIIFLWLMFRARNQSPKGRFHRLSRMLAHPRASDRYPHRAVERFHRSVFPPPRRKLRRLLKTLPKNTSILTNGPKHVDAALPAPSDTFFEPAGIHEESEYMDIIRLGYDEMMPYPDTDEDHSENRKGRRAPISFWIRRIGGMITSLMGMAWFLWSLILGIYDKDYLFIIMCIYGMLIFLGICMIPLFYANQWWLIPGGIIGREYRLWKKRLNIRIIRASQAASFYDMCQKKLYITHAGRVITLSLQPIQYLAFLVGWFSTARPPSEEEIRSFLAAR